MEGIRGWRCVYMRMNIGCVSLVLLHGVTAIQASDCVSLRITHYKEPT